MNALAATRLSFCKRCPTPCAPFTAGTLDHADVDATCELATWRSRAWAEAQPLRIDERPGDPMPVGLAAVAIRTSAPCTKAAAKKWGPPMWAELHAVCEAGQLTPAWLEAWLARVPCADCRRHAREILALHPPDFTDAPAQSAWAFHFHTAVRQHLGQPEHPPIPPGAHGAQAD